MARGTMVRADSWLDEHKLVLYHAVQAARARGEKAGAGFVEAAEKLGRTEYAVRFYWYGRLKAQVENGTWMPELTKDYIARPQRNRIRVRVGRRRSKEEASPAAQIVGVALVHNALREVDAYIQSLEAQVTQLKAENEEYKAFHAAVTRNLPVLHS